TSQIALEQRFQHEHQRIALLAAQFAAGEVASNAVRLEQRDAQLLLLLQGEHGCAVIPPDAFPLQYEPWRKIPGATAAHLGLQGLGSDPAPGANLIPIDHELVGGTPYEDRAELVLGARRIELRLILKLEQKMQWTAQTQLLVEAALGCRLHGLVASGVTAAAIGPVPRPEPLRYRP